MGESVARHAAHGGGMNELALFAEKSIFACGGADL